MPPLIELDEFYRSFSCIKHDLDLNEYDFSKLSTKNDESDDDDTSNNDHNRLKVSKNKYSFNIQHTDGAVKSLIKNKIEETINEILAIYLNSAMLLISHALMLLLTIFRSWLLLIKRMLLIYLLQLI